MRGRIAAASAEAPGCDDGPEIRLVAALDRVDGLEDRQLCDGDDAGLVERIATGRGNRDRFQSRTISALTIVAVPSSAAVMTTVRRMFLMGSTIAALPGASLRERSGFSQVNSEARA